MSPRSKPTPSHRAAGVSAAENSGRGQRIERPSGAAPSRAPRARSTVEKELAQVEAKYRSMFENAVEGIFQTTPDGHYLSANPALARMYGYSSTDQLLAGISDIGRQLYVDDDRRADFQRLLASQDAVLNFESQIRRKDGSVIWISENARAVRDDAGRLLYYEGAVQDISERKRAEEALDRQMAETREAYDRLRETEVQLVQSEKLTAVGMLVAGLAHELNNPLTVILGFAELLGGRSDLDPLVHSHLEHIARAGTRAKSIVAKLTTFAGLHKPEKARANVNEIAEAALESLADDLARTHVKLRRELGQALPDTWLDAGQMEQVLVNLCLNALQAMDALNGGGTLTVSTRSGASGGIEIWISDDGPGIDDESKTKVFDPFYTTKDVGQGTGLGLSIAFRIVEKHGGQIRVIDSEPGPGATFVIELPGGNEPGLAPLARAARAQEGSAGAREGVDVELSDVDSDVELMRPSPDPARTRETSH